MPKDSPVSAADAFGACEALLAEGVWPSQRDVQARTRGSFSKIGPLVKQWQQQFMAKRATENRIGAVPAEVVALAEQTYRLAITEAQTHLADTLAQDRAALRAARHRAATALLRARQHRRDTRRQLKPAAEA